MILVLLEQEAGGLNAVSLEASTLARRLGLEQGLEVAGVLLGASVPAEMPAMPLERAFYGQHPRLDHYAPEAWAESLRQLLSGQQVEALIAPGTERGNEVMAHLAARLDLPLATHCTAVEAGPRYRVTRLRWGGSLLEEAWLDGQPRLLTVAPHAVAPHAVAPHTEAAGTVLAMGPATAIPFNPTLGDKPFRAQLKEQVDTAGDRVSLAEARVVVGGGRGVGSSEGFAPLEELAALLGGAVGCSRAVTNHGWRPHADQVGQTGSRIAPELYIACGISGAVQHMVGAKGARHILAVNTDPEAPILARADYAIIGDLHQVVPALCLEIKRQRGG